MHVRRCVFLLVSVLALAGCVSTVGRSDPRGVEPGNGGSGGTGGGGGTGGEGEAGAGGAGEAGAGGAPELLPDRAGWAAAWCQRFARGLERPGYPDRGPTPDPHAYFYGDAVHRSGAALRTQLHAILDRHAIPSYREARERMFGVLDDRDGDVTCVYTGRVVHAGGAIPDHRVMNTEHTWPQSRFGRRDSFEGAKSDLHHLFPSDRGANSTRGNSPFGHPSRSIREVTDPTRPAAITGSRLGEDDAGRRVFEPRNEHKGNVARALFYFAVRYRREIDPWQEEILRCWHALDPPDADEVARTDAIEQLQGTRNPFVDHPEFVDRIPDF